MFHLWFLTVDLIYIHFVPFVTSIPWCKAFFPDPALLTKMTRGLDYEWTLFREIYPGLVQRQAHIHKWVCTDCIRKGKQWGIPSLGPFKCNLQLPFPTLFHLALCLWDQSAKISGDWFGEERRAISGNPFSWFSPGNCLWLCPLPGPLKSIGSLGF